MKPGSDIPSLILRNDSVVSLGEPVVHLDDAAIVQGHGLFETIRIYGSVPFALDAHLIRMTEGAERLGLRAPDKTQALGSIQRLLDVNAASPETDYRLRITLTGGNGDQVTFYELSPCPAHPATASVITGPRFVRNERGLLSGIKTLSYGENAIATRLTREAGATEALWSNTAGELCEGTWSNVFVRIQSKWQTPALVSGCLPGVTRATVLAIANRAGLEIEETSIPHADLARVEAAFLTSSIREIQPVSSLDGRSLDPDPSGEVSRLRHCFIEEINPPTPSR